MNRLNSIRNNESGFTLTEIMAASAIITIGILGIMIVFNSTLNTQTNTKVRTLATNIATEKVEAARTIAYDTLTQEYLAANLGTTATKGGVTFTITYTVAFVDDPSDGTGTGDLNPNDFKNVQITVAWTNPQPSSSVVIDTLINKNPVAPASASTDTTAPVWPNAGVGVLSGRAEQTTPGLGMYIQWSPNWATDANGVVGYLIYRQPPDDTSYMLIATVAPSVGWFLDNYYTAGGSYNFYVKAFDGAGNLSGPCNIVTIVGPADTIAPSIPLNVTGQATSPTTGTLSWSLATDNSGVVDHYNIYRTHSGNPFGNTPYTSKSSPPFNDTGLSTGITYQYYIAAVDPTGNEGGKSTTVSITP
ncbi:MAG: fibronectin type III domain-containing protein [Actinomycetota bacterium]